MNEPPIEPALQPRADRDSLVGDLALFTHSHARAEDEGRRNNKPNHILKEVTFGWLLLCCPQAEGIRRASACTPLANRGRNAMSNVARSTKPVILLRGPMAHRTDHNLAAV